MKSQILINLLSLFAINVLIIFQIKDLFDLTFSLQNFLITIFAFLFAMLILITFTNILFNLVLKYLTSFDLDYEQNQEKVLTSIFLVNQILFLILYIFLLIDKTYIYTLQNFKYVTPIVFSLLFATIMRLKRKDFVLFNVGVIGIQFLLLILQKLYMLTYGHFM